MYRTDPALPDAGRGLRGTPEKMDSLHETTWQGADDLCMSTVVSVFSLLSRLACLTLRDFPLFTVGHKYKGIVHRC